MLPAVTGVVPDFSPTGSRLTPATEEDAPTLEPIPGTNNFRLNGKLKIYAIIYSYLKITLSYYYYLNT